MVRTIEVLVRTVAARSDEPAEEREIRGDTDVIATELRRFADLGIDHLQAQLRLRTMAGLEAFAPVIERLRGSPAT